MEADSRSMSPSSGLTRGKTPFAGGGLLSFHFLSLFTGERLLWRLNAALGYGDQMKPHGSVFMGCSEGTPPSAGRAGFWTFMVLDPQTPTDLRLFSFSLMDGAAGSSSLKTRCSPAVPPFCHQGTWRGSVLVLKNVEHLRFSVGSLGRGERETT